MQVNICDICGTLCTGNLYKIMIYKDTDSDIFGEGTIPVCNHEICPKCYTKQIENIWRTEDVVK